MSTEPPLRGTLGNPVIKRAFQWKFQNSTPARSRQPRENITGLTSLSIETGSNDVIDCCCDALVMSLRTDRTSDPALSRKSLDGLNCVRRAAPSQKFKFLIFKRIGCLEEFLQFVDCSCRKTPHVL
jgi:hypothetical protein